MFMDTKNLLEINELDALDQLILEEEERQELERPVKPYDVRLFLTDEEWRQIEDYYIQAVQRIVVPENPTSKEIMSLNAELDRLYTEARFDQGFLTAKVDQIKRELSDARKTVYEYIKDQAKNDKERDALGTKRLENLLYRDTGKNIFEVHDIYVARKEFLDAVVSILRAKADRLVLDIASMKVEASL